jgi:hypothetical protein
MVAVHASLAVSREFRGDQGRVWDGIAQMSDAALVHSRTGAMKDVYEAKRAALDDYLKCFSTVDGQKGMLVFLGGKAVGLDFVSRPAAFGLLFPKLVKSYAMEAMLAAEQERRDHSKVGDHGEEPKPANEKGRTHITSLKVPAQDAARAFLASAASCDEQKQESVGLGWYSRYSGKAMVGSALAVEEKVVHMAFFSVDEAEQAGPMAGMRSRRGFRID